MHSRLCYCGTQVDVVAGDAVLEAMDPKQKAKEMKARDLIKAGFGHAAALQDR